MHPTPMHAHYLTVSESRRWAMDNPVGNPYHDFKTKEMPVVAVAVIAYGASMAYAAGTLLSLGGLMMASGALSLAGQLTGNRTLSTLGAVAGVAAAGIGLWQAASAAGGVTTGEAVTTMADAGADTSAGITSSVQAAPVAGADAALAANSGIPSTTINLADTTAASGMTGADLMAASTAPSSQSATSIGSLIADPVSSSGFNAMGNGLTGAAPSAAAPFANAYGLPEAASGLGAGIGESGAMSVTGSAPSAAAPVDAAAGGADAGSSINIRTDGGAMQSEAAKAVKEGASYGSDVAGNSGSSSAAGSGDQGLLGSAKKFGEFVIDPKNKDFVTKTMDMGGQMFKAYSEKDLYDAQEELAKAQASGVQANIELARAKVEEVNYALELAKKRQQNINTRATSAAAQAGAINPNANIFSTAAKPAQGGLIFSGAK